MARILTVLTLLSLLAWSNAAGAEEGYWAPGPTDPGTFDAWARGNVRWGTAHLVWSGAYGIASIATTVAGFNCSDGCEGDPDCDPPEIGCMASLHATAIAFGAAAIPHLILGIVLMARGVRQWKMARSLRDEVAGGVPLFSVAVLPGRGGGIGLTWAF